MLLHIGFEPPTPEIMEAWKAWFADVDDAAIEHGGFMSGNEITAGGEDELPWGPDAMMGYSIIAAETMEAALAIARQSVHQSNTRSRPGSAHRKPAVLRSPTCSTTHFPITWA
jgi:hypothetical protein